MKVAMIEHQGREQGALLTENGLVTIKDLRKVYDLNLGDCLFDLLSLQQLPKLQDFFSRQADSIQSKCASVIIPKDDAASVNYLPPYRCPRKIWGIGLNYCEHASDLDEIAPQSIPASFMKADTTIIGYNDAIKIPKLSNKTTGEAELGIIIGKKCRNIEKENWLDYVAGFTCILDMTAEDILRKNPRYLTVSKNFDTFFSFGPFIITPDEIENIRNINVATVLNDNVHAKNVVSNMTFPPDFLVSFHSKVMTLFPGDIISTGTPRAVKISHNDVIECRIDGFTSLKNHVVDLKKLNERM